MNLCRKLDFIASHLGFRNLIFTSGCWGTEGALSLCSLTAVPDRNAQKSPNQSLPAMFQIVKRRLLRKSGENFSGEFWRVGKSRSEKSTGSAEPRIHNKFQIRVWKLHSRNPHCKNLPLTDWIVGRGTEIRNLSCSDCSKAPVAIVWGCSNDPRPGYFKYNIAIQMGDVSWYKLVAYTALCIYIHTFIHTVCQEEGVLLQKYRD